VAGHAPDRLDVGAASRGAARRGADAVGRLEAGASEIRLGPLDETAVAQVARDMLGGEPDEALRKVLSRADGQPFPLTELLRGLRLPDVPPALRVGEDLIPDDPVQAILRDKVNRPAEEPLQVHTRRQAGKPWTEPAGIHCFPRSTDISANAGIVHQ